VVDPARARSDWCREGAASAGVRGAARVASEDNVPWVTRPRHRTRRQLCRRIGPGPGQLGEGAIALPNRKTPCPQPFAQGMQQGGGFAGCGRSLRGTRLRRGRRPVLGTDPPPGVPRLPRWMPPPDSPSGVFPEGASAPRRSLRRGLGPSPTATGERGLWHWPWGTKVNRDFAGAVAAEKVSSDVVAISGRGDSTTYATIHGHLPRSWQAVRPRRRRWPCWPMPMRRRSQFVARRKSLCEVDPRHTVAEGAPEPDPSLWSTAPVEIDRALAREE
jgi:hypothetical protein